MLISFTVGRTNSFDVLTGRVFSSSVVLVCGVAAWCGMAPLFAVVGETPSFFGVYHIFHFLLIPPCFLLLGYVFICFPPVSNNDKDVHTFSSGVNNAQPKRFAHSGSRVASPNVWLWSQCRGSVRGVCSTWARHCVLLQSLVIVKHLVPVSNDLVDLDFLLITWVLRFLG